MNLTIKLYIADHQGAVLIPAGAIAEVYDADEVAERVAGEYVLKRAPRQSLPFGFVHIRDYPHAVDIKALNALLLAPAEHEAQPIRARNWLADIGAFSAGTLSRLASTREVTIDGSDGAVIGYLKYLTITNLQDPETDTLGRSITTEELPSDGPQ